MGTRADFYVGRGKEAEWLGSIAWDGDPGGIDEKILKAQSEEEFRRAFAAFAATREDFTAPSEGWPWPWTDSQTTDYSYAWDDDAVYISRSGHGWIKASEYDEDSVNPKDPQAEFPDMTERMKVQLGRKSGILMIEVPAEEETT